MGIVGRGRPDERVLEYPRTMSSRTSHQSRFFFHDIGIIVLSVLVAVVLARTGVLVRVLTATQEAEYIGSFVAGLFFTSVFTTAPAIVVLGEIAQVNSLIATAFFGALGAVLGDLVIFRFVRERFSEHLGELVREMGMRKRTRALFRMKFFRWFTFFLGGLVIASPLPDELGVSLLGFSRLKLSLFMPLSFVFNFFGIYLIGIAARAVA